MLKKVLIGLIGVVVVFLGVTSMQPSEFQVTRSSTINAAPAKVFNLVNDFHQWSTWSPWDKMDPTMKKTYEGPATGAGATYAWVGNGQVGEGKMTITKSETPALVEIQLEFLKPMKATNFTRFTFKPEGQGTLVTWTMTGHNNLIAKAFHMIMNVDKMVGGDFERGLAQMKAAAE